MIRRARSESHRPSPLTRAELSGRVNMRPAWNRGTHKSGRRRVRGPVDQGSSTAEMAAGLPALMLLLFVGLTAVTAVTTRLACVDAAREAALAASRGERGEEAGRRVAPDGAAISVTVGVDQVTVTVVSSVRALGTRLPAMTVTASAVAAVEPGVPGAAL